MGPADSSEKRGSKLARNRDKSAEVMLHASTVRYDAFYGTSATIICSHAERSGYVAPAITTVVDPAFEGGNSVRLAIRRYIG